MFPEAGRSLQTLVKGKSGRPHPFEQAINIPCSSYWIPIGERHAPHIEDDIGVSFVLPRREGAFEAQKRVGHVEDVGVGEAEIVARGDLGPLVLGAGRSTVDAIWLEPVERDPMGDDEGDGAAVINHDDFRGLVALWPPLDRKSVV